MDGEIARLRVYPIKSIDGAEVEASRFLASGALEHDREFAIVERDGSFVTGKRDPRTHLLRARWNLAEREGTLTSRLLERSQRFAPDGDTREVEAFLSEHFGRPVGLVRNALTGFPDDSCAPGPTIISTATLEAVASWFPDLEVESVRRRLRPNVEIEGVPAFWEDALFAEEGTLVPFKLGDAGLDGVNPCARASCPRATPTTARRPSSFRKPFRSGAPHRYRSGPSVRASITSIA